MRHSKPANALLLLIMRNRITYIVIGVICVLMAIFIRPDLFKSARVTILNTLSPAISSISSQKKRLQDVTGGITTLSELKAENDRLVADNIKLQQWYQSAIALETENRTLRNLLNVKTPPEQSAITVRVLSDTGSRFVKTLLIDAGTGEGLQKNQSVLTQDGLLGRVIEPGRTISRVLLLTDINSRIPVMIAQTNQHAIMVGDNSATPFLDYLSEDTKIDAGATVITSGRTGMFPYGLAIGTVMIDDKGAYKVKLFADAARLMYVIVLNTPLRSIDMDSNAIRDVQQDQIDLQNSDVQENESP